MDNVWYKLITEGVVNKWRLLLNYYRKLNITEEELCLIFLVMHLSNSKHDFVSSSVLIQYSSFSKEQINNLFSSLTKKQLLKVQVVDFQYKMEFAPLFQQIVLLINEDKKTNVVNSQDERVIKLINEKLLIPMTRKQIKNLQSVMKTYNIDYTFFVSFVQRINTKLNFETFMRNLTEYLQNNPPSLTQFNWLG